MEDMNEKCVRSDKRKINPKSVLIKNIEYAIRNSLDPLSAKRALESLLPVLEDLSLSDGRKHIGNDTSREDRSHLSWRKEKESHLRRKHDHSMTLPSIETILSEYRRVTADQNLRSTAQIRSVSEPIPVTEMFSRQSLIPVQSKSIGESTSRKTLNLDQKLLHDFYTKKKNQEVYYNADAAVSLLQLERRARKPNFSGFWDWKMQHSPPEDFDVSNSKISLEKCSSKSLLAREIQLYTGSAHIDTDKKEKGGEKEKRVKIERISRMKQAYSSRKLDAVNDLDVTDNLSANSADKNTAVSANVPSSNGHNSQVLAQNMGNKQNINEINGDITRADMITISKYFVIDDDISDSSTPQKWKTNVVTEERETDSETLSCRILSNDEFHMNPNLNLDRNTINQDLVNSNNRNIQYRLDPLIMIQNETQRDCDENYKRPCVYNNFSPKNATSCLRLNPIMTSPSTTNDSNDKYLLTKKNSNFKDIFCDDINQPTGRSIDTPNMNDYYLGGVDGLLDWTKTLDLDI